ncbi:MAG TPA: efflux transporter outer membrane subunit [Sphingomicrobium sp.]|nr:efflux transporter outer membrane subunit [Sphingomicrobium sp.]
MRPLRLPASVHIDWSGAKSKYAPPLCAGQAIVLSALLLVGCTVGPDYRQPQLTVPQRYLEAPAGQSVSDAELARWWQSFGDPQLNSLVERAVAQNLDIEAAGARIREARALERSAGAGALPHVAAQSSLTRQRISENAIPSPPGTGPADGGGFALPGEEFTTWRIGFDAGWEIDLFGRNVREREAAGARNGAAIWNYHDSQVSVTAELADAYLRFRALQSRVRIAEEELARLRRFERLATARERGGLVTGEDVAEQRSASAAAAAAIPQLEAQARVEVHALGVLTGSTPDSLAAELETPATLPAAPAIPPGLPSDLLRRRPDIRAAERELAAATADVGVAVADLYPRFSLTAAPALVSTALTSLIEWGSRAFTAGAAIDWPLFDGGRRRATVEARTARQEHALIAYRKTVLLALKEVEDALSRIDGSRRQLSELEDALGAANRAEEIAASRYRGGLVTYSDVLQAQSRRISLEGQLVETKAALARDSVALFKALGGGWKPEELQ